MSQPQSFTEYAAVIVQVDAPGLVQPFTYGITGTTDIAIGDAVIVPFGATTAIGYVVGTSKSAAAGLQARVKPITCRLENGATFDAEMLALAKWVATDTFTDIRDVIRLIAPEIMTSQIKTVVRLAPDWRAHIGGTRSTVQMTVAAVLDSLGGTSTAVALARAVRSGSPATDTGSLWEDSPLGEVDPGRTSGDEAPSTKLTAILADLRRKGVITQEQGISPPKARARKVLVLRLAAGRALALEEADRLERRNATRQAALLRALLASAEDARAQHSIPTSGLAIAPGAHAAARALCEKGLVSYAEVPVYRNPFRLYGEASDTPPPLTSAQAEATRVIAARLAMPSSSTILLHGVTGSGKTEVYLDAVARTLATGRSALVLLPEIGLTAQFLDLFKARFDDNAVAVLHSALSHGERYDEWQRIKSGAARVVLGARSAVFAPTQNLGLVILDEEHDGSYKQDNAPRYHARDVAQHRAQASRAVVVLGSATPSLESYYKATRGEYEMVKLTERIDSRPLPPVHIVDLREEFARPSRKVNRDTSPLSSPSSLEAAGAPSIFGKQLAQAIGDRLSRREQTILFLNRRGFATFLLCRDCGHTPQCPNCAVALTYHHGARSLRCHHCNFERRAPDACTKCGGLRVRPFGLGTEKVEDTVRAQFPDARMIRMDRDTMTRKGAHGDALRRFRRGDADVLIGTQMVAKGLDFPNVTLVGVVSADTALNMPDFRASERAFQLLTQVAGRAGRGKRPGEVIIQTFNPDHVSVQRAAEHDYAGFYAQEIEHRGELHYPPFAHMANIVVSDQDDRQAQTRVDHLAGVIRRSIREVAGHVHLLGPTSCPLSRLKNRYRWHLVLRSVRQDNLHTVIRHALSDLSTGERQGLSIDIDPLTML